MRARIRTIAATKGFAVLATLAMGGSTAMALEVPVAPALPTAPTISTPVLPGQSTTPATQSGAPALPTAPRQTVLSAPRAPGPTVPHVPTLAVGEPVLPAAPRAPSSLIPAATPAKGGPAHTVTSAPKAVARSYRRPIGRRVASGASGSEAGAAGPLEASAARTAERNTRAPHRLLPDALGRTTHDQAAAKEDPSAGAGPSGKPEGQSRSFFGNVGNAAWANGPRWALVLIIAFALTIPAVAVMRTARRPL